MAQPVFHGGALLAQRRANIAAFQQAEAQYRQTVLQAFQNVADVLRALETDARALKTQVIAEDAARRALKVTMDQYRLGGASYIDLLNTQQQYQLMRIDGLRRKPCVTRIRLLCFRLWAVDGGKNLVRCV